MKSPFSDETIDWNFGIIKLAAAAMARHARNSGYPLQSNVFYGDYAAAVDLMRPYPPRRSSPPRRRWWSARSPRIGCRN